MKVLRTIIGIVLFSWGFYVLVLGINIRFLGSKTVPLIFLGLIGIGSGIFLLKNKKSLFATLSSLGGGIAIIAGSLLIMIRIMPRAYAYDISWLDIAGITFIFLVGVLTILPERFYKKVLLRKISYLISGTLILALVVFLLWGRGNESIVAGTTLWGLLLACIWCVPFLIIKSKRGSVKERLMKPLN